MNESDLGAHWQVLAERRILEEPPKEIRERLVLAIQEAALESGNAPRDAGLAEWATDFARRIELAVRREICANDGGLNPKYDALLDKGLTTEGVSAVSSVVLQVVSTINPALAVSSVGLYFAIFLLKLGLTSWCQIPK
jgi:hypothetical protein